VHLSGSRLIRSLGRDSRRAGRGEVPQLKRADRWRCEIVDGGKSSTRRRCVCKPRRFLEVCAVPPGLGQDAACQATANVVRGRTDPRGDSRHTHHSLCRPVCFRFPVLEAVHEVEKQRCGNKKHTGGDSIGVEPTARPKPGCTERADVSALGGVGGRDVLSGCIASCRSDAALLQGKSPRPSAAVSGDRSRDEFE
jgi:hypothetical protein